LHFNSDKFARIISTIFVPPSFTLLTFIFLSNYLENDINKILAIIFVALVFGFIFPILLFLHYRKKGLIVDIDASVKEERTIPMLISVLFFVAGFAILFFTEINLVILAFWFCYISNTLLTVLINRIWKISAHTMGAAGPVAVITFVLGYIGILFLPIVFIVGWSRIRLKCHTFLQVLIGGLLAFISTYFQIYLIVHIIGN
jgi:membrane-associated phospholipid phosphatase